EKENKARKEAVCNSRLPNDILCPCTSIQWTSEEGCLMALFPPAEQRFAVALSGLIFSNPFLPERDERTRDLLGEDATASPGAYHRIEEGDLENPHLARIDESAERAANRARERLVQGSHAGEVELA